MSGTKYFKLKKNNFYYGVDGTRYIPRTAFHAKGGARIAIIEVQKVSAGRFEIHTVVMDNKQLKKALNIKVKGDLTIE